MSKRICNHHHCACRRIPMLAKQVLCLRFVPFVSILPIYDLRYWLCRCVVDHLARGRRALLPTRGHWPPLYAYLLKIINSTCTFIVKLWSAITGSMYLPTYRYHYRSQLKFECLFSNNDINEIKQVFRFSKLFLPFSTHNLNIIHFSQYKSHNKQISSRRASSAITRINLSNHVSQHKKIICISHRISFMGSFGSPAYVDRKTPNNTALC